MGPRIRDLRRSASLGLRCWRQKWYMHVLEPVPSVKIRRRGPPDKGELLTDL